MPAAGLGLELQLMAHRSRRVGLGGRLDGAEVPRRGTVKRLVQQVLHAVGTLDRLQIPGHGNEITPVAGGREQARRGGRVLGRPGPD